MSPALALRKNLPLLIACMALAAVGLISTGWQLSQPFPIHRWESGFVAECFRASRGLPVYESAVHGHATHMYGPLTNLAVGTVFRTTGPGFLPARLLSLMCLIAAACALIRVARPRGSTLATVSAAALIAAFGRAACDYVDPRPDCSSLLCGLLATLLLFESHRRQSWKWVLAGSSCLVVGFLFKQPAAMVAAIPVLAAALYRDTQWTARTVAMLAVPFVAVLTCIGVLRFGFPDTYHYMITVPSSYGIRGADAARWLAWFLPLTAFCWLTVWLDGLRHPSRISNRRTAWLLAAVCVTIPCGVMMAAKTGGSANGLLPAFFAVVGLFLHKSEALERALLRDTDTKSVVARNAGALLAACLVLTLFLSRQHGNSLTNAYGDAGFETVVKIVRQKPGRVVCPQDPATMVIASGHAGRSLILEYDAAGWPQQIPEWFFDELNHADYAVSLTEDWRTWPLSAAAMTQLFRSKGFEPVEVEQLRDSAYRLWHRPKVPPARYADVDWRQSVSLIGEGSRGHVGGNGQRPAAERAAQAGHEPY